MSDKYSDVINFFKQKNYSLAKSKLKQLLQSSPNDIKALNLMGIILTGENKFKEAITFFQKGISLNSNLFDLHSNLAKCHLNLKELDDAKISFQNAALIDNNNEENWINLAIVYKDLNDFQNSLSSIDEALKINSKNFFAWNIRGIVFSLINDYDNAASSFQRAILINSKFGRAYINLAELHKKFGNFELSIKVYKSSINKISEINEVYTNLAGVYILMYQNHQGNNLDLALDYANKSINLNKNNVVTLNNLGLINIYLSKKDEAIYLFQKAKKISHTYFNTYINLALAYKHLGQYENAEKEYKQALKLNPNNYDLQFRISEIQLSNNNFLEGWKNYEKRWFSSDYKKPLKLNLKKPLWKTDLGYKRLLVWAEQGIGDQILFSTILFELDQHFEKIYLYADARLEKLFNENFPNINFISNLDDFDEASIDYHLPLGSLGFYYRKNVHSFINNQKFFQINSNKKFPPKQKNFRCALSWQSTNPDTAKAKSINLLDLQDILKLENIEFYSIQYTDVKNEIDEIYRKLDIQIKSIQDLDTKNDLYSVQQLIDSCDFTITVSNSNAHLSAIIGKPTFLLLNNGIGKLWYWDNELNNINLWYPSIFKFKQTTEGDWKKPIRAMSQAIINKFNN